MRKKRFVRGSLRGKLLILSGAILMLAAAIFLQQREREKARAAYEETIQRESGEEDQEEGQEEEDRKETDTEEQSQDTEGTSGLWDNKAGEIPLIHIRNLGEYATDLMGEDADLLERSLGEWNEKEHLDAESASILNVMIPESDPQSIHFYIRMDDAEGSLILLSYHPGEKAVTALPCDYTEEEILAEAWEGNGPGQRDVTAEADTEFLNDPGGKE